MITIVGAGLAGCEAAWQLAERGFNVRLIEQKPIRRTPAQTSDSLCELVCSNSFRGASLGNAVGLLKEELRRAGSFILQMAEENKVPAGGALAVDREKFSAAISEKILAHPKIEFVREVVMSVPAFSRENPVILATGPLTGDELATSIESYVGARLAYYDAIAPIVSADSIDWTKVFKQSRWGKGEDGAKPAEGAVDGSLAAGPESGASPAEKAERSDEDAAKLGDAAYANCPFTKDEYYAFVAALRSAEKVEARSFEKVRYFEGCLPVEIMAERGDRTLAFGPMKPVGLTDPRTGRWPYAVVQLRPEDAHSSAYNLVGFQTRMTYGEQKRVLRTIPGLENAEFQRFGSVHRNTFVNAPEVLDASLEVKGHPGLYLAGQITGVEGYVESSACGFVCAVQLAEKMHTNEITPPPNTTALGAMMSHLLLKRDDFQPSNITWAHFPPAEDPKLRKEARYEYFAKRALSDLEGWKAKLPIRLEQQP